ncbi:MAG TPA: dTMP kinase [Desulfobacteraceae bacterium]|nr:dTMP kinase [Desulfobacteraceae bacterium]
MFITFEGIEGSGKTSQVKHVARFLQSRGLDCIVTREPGGTKIGRKIRAILLDPENGNMNPAAELFLYMADRAQHLNELIKPALGSGKTVLSDRYFDAALAYQGFARGVDTEFICRMHRFIFEDLKPDITILLDLPSEIGLNRVWKQIRNGSRDILETRIEKEIISFHQKVRAGYLELASCEPDRFWIIDASMDEDKVRKEIISRLESVIKQPLYGLSGQNGS